jgi:hypothetical protein
MAGKTLAGMLAVLASIATILTFIFTIMNRPSTTPQHTPTIAANSSSTVGSSGPANSSSAAGSSGPANSSGQASLVNSYMTNCEQNVGTVSVCRCTLKWFEAHDSYSQFLHDFAALKQFEQNQTAEPSQNVTEAYLACGA